MAADDIDREEVDRLVKALAARQRVTAPPVPAAPAAASQVTAPPKPDAPAETSSVAAAPVTTLGAIRAHAPGRPFTTARLHMPDVSTRHSRRSLAFASAFGSIPMPRLSLPSLADLNWELITARMFVGLGLALSLSLMFWPYDNTCSWGLYLYLAAVMLVVITGVWGAKLTWDMELGAAHTLAVCTIFWGLTLIAAEVLPRVGYAQVQQPWFCAS